MRSLLLEFLRMNDLATGIWRKGDPYLVVAGSDAVRQFTSPLEHTQFLKLTRALRYQGDAARRLAALKDIGLQATELLGGDAVAKLGSGDSPVQLDLVVNPAEVAAYPFEAATDADGVPLFARADPAVVITRRVRGRFAEARTRWPAVPRILYAWASPPDVRSVPSQAHADALRKALAPWMTVGEPSLDAPGNADVLQTLPQVTLAQLQQACQVAAATRKPYTHVHLLAHGVPMGDIDEQVFGIALHAEDGGTHEVSPEDVQQALAPLSGLPVVVTLANCDSDNRTNTITSNRSVAHGLHELGFPVVVASQFPLTVPGSNLFTATFYEALLGGSDVRLALHRARVALYESRQTTGHDWASLVGYVRLPEGYGDHLVDVRLQSAVAALETMKLSDDLLYRPDPDLALLEKLAAEMQRRIDVLTAFLAETRARGRPGALEENLGLLGSAEKRLASLLFARSKADGGAGWTQRMHEALARSQGHYRQAFLHNLSNHWVGAQHVALEAVLEGRMRNPHHWHAAVAAAEADLESSPPQAGVWSLGTLAELQLIAPMAGQAQDIAAALQMLARMKALVRAHDYISEFTLIATARQFQRYVDWWTTSNGFFPGCASDLSAPAQALIDCLRADPH